MANESGTLPIISKNKRGRPCKKKGKGIRTKSIDVKVRERRRYDQLRREPKDAGHQPNDVPVSEDTLSMALNTSETEDKRNESNSAAPKRGRPPKTKGRCRKSQATIARMARQKRKMRVETEVSSSSMTSLSVPNVQDSRSLQRENQSHS